MNVKRRQILKVVCRRPYSVYTKRLYLDNMTGTDLDVMKEEERSLEQTLD